MNADTTTERQARTEEQVKALQGHVNDCMAHFRPGIEARLHSLELKFAYYTGGLAGLQVIIAWALAVYLKR